MWLLRFPGVYAPQHDTRLLAEALRREHLPSDAHVLDLCTGTGTLAVQAARAGASNVTAVDISARAVWSARVNALVRRLPVKVHRGHLTDPVPGQRFGLVLANPPYVPAGRAVPPERRSRAWDAGWDGRTYLDSVCASAPGILTASGVLLMVQSALCGVGLTLRMLREGGLRAQVQDRMVIPFGPVMRHRAAWLEARGYIRRGQREEELVVIRGGGG